MKYRCGRLQCVCDMYILIGYETRYISNLSIGNYFVSKIYSSLLHHMFSCIEEQAVITMNKLRNHLLREYLKCEVRVILS